MQRVVELGPAGEFATWATFAPPGCNANEPLWTLDRSTRFPGRRCCCAGASTAGLTSSAGPKTESAPHDSPSLAGRATPTLFEDPVDPFPTGNAPTPDASVRRYLLKELRPLRLVVAAAVATTILCAAIEVWLIGYAGCLVDTLAAASPDTLWSRHGIELLAVAVFVLLIRPVINLVGEALDDIAFRANARQLARWRAHRHVSRQSVGWFRDDLAGRIATWVRDGGDAASAAAYAVIHTLVLIFPLGLREPCP